MEYVSLHNQTCFSILKSIIKPNDLFKTAAEMNLKAVAVTDDFTLAGIWDSYKAAQKNKVKLIVGCKFNFIDDITPIVKFNKNKITEKPITTPKNLILLAKNQIGYQNILFLNRLSFDSKLGRMPFIDWNLLQQYSEGVVCLTGDSTGILSYDICSDNQDQAIQSLIKLKSIFNDNLFIELCPNNLRYNNTDQALANRRLFKLSKEYNVKCVASDNARYLTKEQHANHDMLMAIGNGRNYNDRSRPRFDLPQLFLHSGDEIVTFFKRNFGQEFAEELCNNTILVSGMCENPHWVKPSVITGDEKQLPTFPVVDEECYSEFLIWKENNGLGELADDNAYMRFWCERNWGGLVPKDKEQIYRDRLDLELSVIEQLNFSSYMLITADFIRWARDRKIPVGPGRGSIGGCLVGFLLGIHKADPIHYGLIFERFLNLSKPGYPDIDNDFSSDGRDKVIDYVSNKYGRNFVAHVSNFICFTPKIAITDVITSLEIGGSRKDAFNIAKNITETIDPNSKNMEDAISSSKLFQEFLKEHPEIKGFAEGISGIPRSYATHACGIIVGKYDLFGLAPLRVDDKSHIALELDKDRADELGLVKIDFLGLETLNIINRTNEIVKSLNLTPAENPPDYNKYYKEAYDLVSTGNTGCIFQFGASGGTVLLCNTIEPKSIDDFAVITALARPGVLPQIKKSYIERKFGREEYEIPHPNLKRAVEATYGYAIFEESFLYLAHDFCGWDLTKSDKMRKISKLKAKGKHLLDELQEDFINGAMNHSKVTKQFAQNIWDEWVIPLANYMFNKAHSVTYSLTSFHTAYLKAYYHNPFMTANLISETNSNNPQSKDNIIKIKNALRKNKVEICPPNINESFENYRLVEEYKLLTGFSSLHGVKEPAALEIVKNRPFSSFEDFLLRTSSSAVRAPTIQALAACGSLDGFGISRKSMYLYCSDLRKKHKAWIIKNPGKKFEYNLPEEEFTKGELRALETHFIGEPLTGNKKDSFNDLFSGISAICKLDQIAKKQDKEYVVCEVQVIDLFSFKVKKEDSKIKGKECCKMVIEDLYDNQSGIIFFPEALLTLRDMFEELFPGKKMEKGFGIRVSATISSFGGEKSLIANDVIGIFMPVEMPRDLTQRTIASLSIKGKKIEEVTTNDFEDDLLSIIDNSNQEESIDDHDHDDFEFDFAKALK